MYNAIFRNLIMGELQQYPACIHNILDYQKSPGIDLLISGRLGLIAGGLVTLGQPLNSAYSGQNALEPK